MPVLTAPVRTILVVVFGLLHLGFALTMFTGAAACLLHGLFPFAFQTSGSRRIKALHARMVTARHRMTEAQAFLGWAEGI